jgi:S1-C subfamily serine protease
MSAVLVTCAAPAGPVFPQPVVEVVEQAKPSTAFVLAQGDFRTASGSAFVVDPNGILITSLHVVADARAITVLLPGGQPQDAEVLGVNVTDDLAVLHVPETGLPALRLGDASGLQVGQDAVVIGYPRADVLGPYDLTVARGVISSIQVPFLQVDAPIGSGESGGPVLAPSGDVIGVAEGAARGAQRPGLVVSVGAVKALLASTLQPSKTSTPLSLPLATMRPVQLAYTSQGIGGGGHREELAASCLAPPPGARSLVAVHGELRVPFTMDVATWLSLGSGAPEGGLGTFAELGVAGNHVLTAATWRELDLPPDTVCVNYDAVNGVLLPVGMTFGVTYWLLYDVWSSAVMP